MNSPEILEIIKKEDVKFVKLMFVDVRGELKALEIAAAALPSALEKGVVIDGSGISGINTPVHSSDVLLMPDKNTLRRLPFFDSEYGRIAMMMCDLCDRCGVPLVTCTRSNLKYELQKMRGSGFDEMNVGFEPEFFLLNVENNAVDTDSYCSTDEFGMKIRRQIMFELGRIGIEAATSHHERAASQYEITYTFTDALTACDNVLLVKHLIKEIAKSHNLRATFEPKPFSNMNGSGLHTNISLIKGGNNVFAGTSGGISAVAKSFVAGVLHHARGLCFLTNPSKNSYKRLGIDGYEAPVNICYGTSNRSTMVRVPCASGKSTRIEIRSTDSSANPYLAVAGILSAGLDAIKNNMAHAEATELDVFALTRDEKTKIGIAFLPTSLAEAAAEFEKNAVLNSCMSPALAAVLAKLYKE